MEKRILNKINNYLKKIDSSFQFNDINDYVDDFLVGHFNIITALVNLSLIKKTSKKTLTNQIEYLIYNCDLSDLKIMKSIIDSELFFKKRNDSLNISIDAYSYLVAGSIHIFENDDLLNDEELLFLNNLKKEIKNNYILRKINNNKEKDKLNKI